MRQDRKPKLQQPRILDGRGPIGVTLQWGGQANGPGHGGPASGMPASGKPARYPRKFEPDQWREDLYQWLYSIAECSKEDKDRIKAAEVLLNRIDGLPIARNLNANMDMNKAAGALDRLDLRSLPDDKLALLVEILGIKVEKPPPLTEEMSSAEADR